MPVDFQRAPATLGPDAIASRIPHQGAMCLLGSVTAWDDERIRCEAGSHRAASNPLRAHGRLGAACGVEYAAQAMALHGALIAEAHGAAGGAPKTGYLASIRGLTLHVDRLDDLDGVLTITAERLSGDEHTVLYGFSLHAGRAPLVSGRAVVVLDAAGFSPCVSTGRTI